MDRIISVNNVTFSYGVGNILENLSLDIYRGDFIAITGANGSGKTTLIKLILNELPLKTGSIEIATIDINLFKDWSKIGYVPQINSNNIPNFPISALEIVTLNLYNKMGIFKFSKKIHNDIAKRALAQVNMLDFAKKPINQMSGGQQQRVMIAKALVNNPKVLIFDEPTTGIDKESKDQLFRILSHLNKVHGITIILITHELEIMKDKITRIIEVRDKKVEEKQC